MDNAKPAGGAPTASAQANPEMQEMMLPSHDEAQHRMVHAYGDTLQARVERWIEENQMLALLGGFAFGVFIGSWMRD